MKHKQIILFCLILIAALLQTGCSLPSDHSVLQQAQGFDQGIKNAEFQDPKINGYLQQIGSRIIAAAKLSHDAKWGPPIHFQGTEDQWMFGKIQFHLVNSKTINAFTTGGEHVYVYNELFQMCKNEDELAAVMAHEFAHIYCRHVHRGERRQNGIMAGAVGMGALGLLVGGRDNGLAYAQEAASLGMYGGRFIGMGFTRDDEAEADTVGFHFYCLSGWDPNRFGDFFQSMIDRGFDKTPAMQSDHPTLASRVKIARERAAAMPELGKNPQLLRKPNIVPDRDFRSYLQHAQYVAASTPNDKSIAKTALMLRAIPRSCLTPINAQDQVDAQQELLRQAKSK